MALVRRGIAWARITYTVAAISFSAVISVFFSEYLTNDSGRLEVIAAIFSILAGVLMAIISILGDPSMLIDKTWRTSYVSAEETQRKLQRQIDIFVLYIFLLVAVFVFSLSSIGSDLYWWMQRIVLFLTSLSFLASLSLPFTLRNIQGQRLQKAIEAARNSANKPQK